MNSSSSCLQSQGAFSSFLVSSVTAFTADLMMLKYEASLAGSGTMLISWRSMRSMRS